MRVSAGTAPAASFLVEATGNGMCRIRFYENAEEKTVNGEDGSAERTEWAYDEYTIVRPYYPSIASDIAGNYNAWLSAAKQEELRNQPADYVGLRADVDYIMALEGLV